MITISRNGIESNKELSTGKHAHCVFEYIYFARLDSMMDGVKIYDARIRGGKSLAKSYPVEADLVTGVPESGIPAAKGYSEESGIRLALLFIRTAILEEHLSNQRRKNESPVYI